MRPHGSPQELEKRRKEAIDLLERGYAPVEVARQVGADRRSVRRWNAAYKKKGVNGIEAKSVSGRPSKLDGKQKNRLEKALLEGAGAVGFHTDLWTCPRVAKLIEKRFGVHYHAHHVAKLLRSLGWTPQKPRRQARERDEERIKTWIKQEWPRIKKKPRGSKPPSSS